MLTGVADFKIYNNMHAIITCHITFGDESTQSYFDEFEFISLPPPVQKEVQDYFKSNDFIELMEEYVISDPSSPSTYFGSVTSITLNVIEGALFVNVGIRLSTRGSAILFSDFNYYVVDGLHKSSHEGEIVYGRHLAKDYYLYFTYPNTHCFRLNV